MNNNNWKFQYFEKNSNELSVNIFKSLEIEHYLKKILKDHGFHLHKHKLNFSNSRLNVFLSVHKTQQTNFNIKKKKTFSINPPLSLQEKKLAKLKVRLKKYVKNLNTKAEYLKMLKLYKNLLLKLKTPNLKPNLTHKILEGLNLFNKNKLNIVVTIEEIHFRDTTSATQQVFMNLRHFEKTTFFNDGKFLLLLVSTQKNSAEILGTFIATQLGLVKRHNFFFNFLNESLTLMMNQQFSRIQGIKILIKGRLNNAPRSNHRVIKLGEIPLMSKKAEIDYFESTAFTSNGTLGVKVWICEKIKKT